MDNLSHGLVGVIIGALRPNDGPPDPNTGLPTRSANDRAVFWSTLLAGNAPDIDVFFPWFLGGGQAASFKYHRGITHSLPGVLVLSAVVTLLIKLLIPKARTVTVYVWSLLSMSIAHVFLDLLTSYGTRALLPWSDQRFSWDILMIVDPIVTLPMGVAVIYGRYRPRLRRRALMAAGAFVLLYIGARTYIHYDFGTQLVREMSPQGKIVKSNVLPGLIGLTSWNYAVEYEDRFIVGSISFPYHRKSEETVQKTREDEVIRAAFKHADVKEFLKFATYPQVTYERQAEGYRLLIYDLRYRLRGRNAFGALVVLDNQLNIIQVNLRHGGFRGEPDANRG